MKNLFLIYTVITLFSVKVNAQTLNHETIATVKVSYKAAPLTTTSNSVSATPQIKGVPQSTISLKNTEGILKVHFKIINKATNAVVYQVNYAISSSVVTNAEGKKLFENNNSVIFISNGAAIDLKPYLYQVQTEDSQNHLSTIYSVTQ